MSIDNNDYMSIQQELDYLRSEIGRIETSTMAAESDLQSHQIRESEKENEFNSHIAWLHSRNYYETRHKLINFSYYEITECIEYKKHTIIENIKNILSNVDDSNGDPSLIQHQILVDSIKEYVKYHTDVIGKAITTIHSFIKDATEHAMGSSVTESSFDDVIHNVFNKDVVKLIDDFYSAKLFRNAYEDVFEIILSIHGMTDWNSNKNIIRDTIREKKIMNNEQLSKLILEDSEINDIFMSWFISLDGDYMATMSGNSIKIYFHRLFVLYIDKLLYPYNELRNSLTGSNFFSSKHYEKIQCTFFPLFLNSFSKIDTTLLSFYMEEILDIEEITPHNFLFNQELFDRDFHIHVQHTEKYEPSVLNAYYEYYTNEQCFETRYIDQHIYKDLSKNNTVRISYKDSLYATRLILLFKFWSCKNKDTIKDNLRNLMTFIQNENEDNDNIDFLLMGNESKFRNFVSEKQLCDTLKQIIRSQKVLYQTFDINDGKISLKLWSNFSNSVKSLMLPNHTLSPLLDEKCLINMYHLSNEEYEDSVKIIENNYDLNRVEKDWSYHNISSEDKQRELFEREHKQYVITLPVYFRYFLFICEEDMMSSDGSSMYSPMYMKNNDVVSMLRDQYPKFSNMLKLYD